MNKPYTYPEIERIARLWKAGHRVMTISMQSGRSVGSIYDLSRRYRDMFGNRPVGRRPVINVAEAAQMRRSGSKLAEIAARYRVSVVSVHKALRRAA